MTFSSGEMGGESTGFELEVRLKREEGEQYQ